eukprot:tig00001388_g8585.t1
MPVRARATCAGVVIAEGDAEIVSQRVWFHPSALPRGERHYYDLHVRGETLKDAAFYYVNCRPGREVLEGCVRFVTEKGISVSVVGPGAEAAPRSLA